MDLIALTQHDRQAAEDYELCRSVGIRVVREAVRWPLVDQGDGLNLSAARRLARLGREMGLTQIWDLMHYGYPDGADPFQPGFAERFCEYVWAVARMLRAESEGPLYFTPINEISYYAWAGGQVGYMAPFAQARGDELKRSLVRAAIAATNAIWATDPQASMVNVDPLVRVHAPPERPDLQPEADHFNQEVVTEAYDLLAGKREPELGGSRAHLGLVGLNYFAQNQWTLATPDLPQRNYGPQEPGWVPLHALLQEMQARYGGPLAIAETGASGASRPAWLRYVSTEVQRALALGVEVQGICLYPAVTSPDWEDSTAFFEGGLFDVAPQPDGTLKRRLYAPLATALREAQAGLDPACLPAAPSHTADAEQLGEPAIEPQVIKPLEQAIRKRDNFSYQVLFAGQSLLIEVYGLEPGATLAPHRHERTEHVWTVLEGEAEVYIAQRCLTARVGETIALPAGVYHSLHNARSQRLVVQQVSSPKPWDARFGGPVPAIAGRPGQIN